MQIPFYEKPSAKHLSFCALFAALCCVATLLIVIPLPHGYFNAGDVFVLLAGWFLGPVYGSVAAAVGSALADVISGYAYYAPITFIIKGSMAFLAYLLSFLLKNFVKKEILDFLPRLISAIFAELLMTAGYFLFESILYGFGGALGSVVGNLLQGACGVAIAVIIAAAVYAIKPVRRFFPALQLQPTP